jgi:hypothetical protein
MKYCNLNSVIISKYEWATSGRDVLFANPTFDFYFKFKFPKPNKERLILERDGFGRITKSQIPSVL